MGNAIKNYQKKQRRDQRDAYREVGQIVKEKLTEMYFGERKNNDVKEGSNLRFSGDHARACPEGKLPPVF